MEDLADVRVRELAHRFRNIVTITRSLVSQTLRSATSIEEARRVTDERLAALDGAIDLLLSANWQPAPLEEIARRALAPFDGLAQRIRVEGPPVPVGSSAALTLALAIHELATNAIKYGALSIESGAIELTWQIIESDKPELWMLWAERGGPPVVHPERQGFGTRLICAAVSRSLRGRAELDYPKTGVTWTLIAPLAAIAT